LALMYNFFKVFLRSAERSAGSTADFTIPVLLLSGESMTSGS
jgi:hypothetical protein